VQPPHVHAEVAHRLGHLGGGRQPVGRAVDQVAGGRRAPPERDGAHHAERQAVAVDHGRDGGQRHGQTHQAVQGPAEVGQTGERHGHGHGQLNDGEPRVEPRDLRGGRPAGAGPDQYVEQEAEPQGDQSGQRHLAHGFQTGLEQADQDQRGDEAERAEEPQGGDEPLHAGRRRMDQLGHVQFDHGVVPDQRNAQHHNEEGQRHAHGVGGSATGPSATAGPEHQGAHALQPAVAGDNPLDPPDARDPAHRWCRVGRGGDRAGRIGPGLFRGHLELRAATPARLLLAVECVRLGRILERRHPCGCHEQIAVRSRHGHGPGHGMARLTDEPQVSIGAPVRMSARYSGRRPPGGTPAVRGSAGRQ
jgi:hypothetical protein